MTHIRNARIRLAVALAAAFYRGRLMGRDHRALTAMGVRLADGQAVDPYAGTMRGVPVPVAVRGGLDRKRTAVAFDLASDALASLDHGATFGGAL